MMISVSDVSKVYALESGDFYALKNTDLHVRKGEFVAIMGPSGSGKSTLLQLLGGLDLPTSGNVVVDGIELTKLNEKERTLFRRTKVGFVFQNYQLLPMMTVGENIALALSANNAPKAKDKISCTKIVIRCKSTRKRVSISLPVKRRSTAAGSDCSSVSDEAKFNFSR